jgi:hypothetical protein
VQPFCCRQRIISGFGQNPHSKLFILSLQGG